MLLALHCSNAKSGLINVEQRKYLQVLYRCIVLCSLQPLKTNHRVALSITLLHTHLVQMVTRGDKKKKRDKRKRERDREGKHISPREELGSFLNFVDRRCCVHDGDRVRNATHQCRLAGWAGRCCLWGNALASMRCHMWSGLEKQNKPLFCQGPAYDIHSG